MYDILVVDDVSLNLLNIKNALGAEYNLTLVKSGTQALRSLQIKIPDLVLLDVMMPDMDGFETYEKIMELKPNENIHFIFLTAVDDKEKIIKILHQKNVAGYILKPYNPIDLNDRVKEFFLRLEGKL